MRTKSLLQILAIFAAFIQVNSEEIDLKSASSDSKEQPLLEQKIIDKFTEISTKLIEAILPMFVSGSNDRSGLVKVMSGLGELEEACDRVPGQCEQYFEQISANPSTVMSALKYSFSKTIISLIKKQIRLARLGPNGTHNKKSNKGTKQTKLDKIVTSDNSTNTVN